MNDFSLTTGMKWAILALVLIVAAVAVTKIFRVGKKIGETAGNITDGWGLTESDKALALKELPMWSPQYFKNAPKGALLMKAARAKELAKKIYDARTFYILDDDETLAAMKQVKNWYQFSQLADTFANTYGKDLYGWCWNSLSDDTKKSLHTFLLSIPKK